MGWNALGGNGMRCSPWDVGNPDRKIRDHWEKKKDIRLYWDWDSSNERLQCTYRIKDRLIPNALTGKADIIPLPCIEPIPPPPLTTLLFTFLPWRNYQPLQPRKIPWSYPKKVKFTPDGLFPYCNALSRHSWWSLFGWQNVTHFLDLYNQLCSDYRLLEVEKTNRLPWYCEFFTGNYIKILIKGVDWATARSILRKEYKNDDLDQLMDCREF